MWKKMETKQKKSEVVQVESFKLPNWTQFVKVLVNEHNPPSHKVALESSVREAHV